MGLGLKGLSQGAYQGAFFIARLQTGIVFQGRYLAVKLIQFLLFENSVNTLELLAKIVADKIGIFKARQCNRPIARQARGQLLVGIALQRRGRFQFVLDTVQHTTENRRDNQVWVGIRPRYPMLYTGRPG